jgi:hypothetical protein
MWIIHRLIITYTFDSDGSLCRNEIYYEAFGDKIVSNSKGGKQLDQT